MPAAAFQATYSDWRLIKGRKQVQIVFEVPLEQASAVHDILGGMPDPSKSVWCAIARLNNEKEAPTSQTTPATKPRADADNATRGAKKWNGMNLAQQAGILCNEAAFWKFLEEEHQYAPQDAEDAAQAVRELCRVPTRSDIMPGTDAGDRWEDLVSTYRAWQTAPSCGA